MNKKYSFKNDYSEGAHPNILNRLSESNYKQVSGYSEDIFTIKAKGYIKELIGDFNPSIHFVSGGTQANLIVISSFLRPHQSVISASTGHINVHETGAIEATGHKVSVINTSDGKLTVDNIKNVISVHEDEHMVKPAMVYISNSTELGTFYNKRELEDISIFCRKNNLILFLDGARLGSALDASGLSIADIAKLVDVFYIGGTKNGALLGEAIVIMNENLQQDFRFLMKQRGALLAKGRLLGIQFLELFQNGLFFELARHANKMANKLADAIHNLNYEFLAEPKTNMIFPILPNKVIAKLSESFEFYTTEKIDIDHSAIRLVTSWATKEEVICSFIEDLKKASL